MTNSVMNLHFTEKGLAERIERERDEARDAALEEAAKLAERCPRCADPNDGLCCGPARAASIRALKRGGGK